VPHVPEMGHACRLRVDEVQLRGRERHDIVQEALLPKAGMLFFFRTGLGKEDRGGLLQGKDQRLLGAGMYLFCLFWC